jgi:hypothetical protein
VAKSKLYVYSTLSASVRYAASEPGGADVPVPTDGILIGGGTNVANKNLITPRGAVITEVSPEQLQRLRDDEVFKLHEANGFVTVSDHLEDGEKVAGSGMETRDASAPLTPEDYKEGDAPKASDAKPTPAPAPAPSNPRKA